MRKLKACTVCEFPEECIFLVKKLERNTMKDITKHYSNEDITIVWKPSMCTHSTLCWKGATGLLSVFNPSKKPWITPEGGTTEEIIERVERCPSGALSYERNV